MSQLATEDQIILTFIPTQIRDYVSFRAYASADSGTLLLFLLLLPHLVEEETLH